MNPPPDPLVRSALAASAAAGPHPDAEVLGLYAERGLDGDERRDVDAHVAACVRCQAIVAEIAVTAPEDASTGAADVHGVLGWFTGWRWLMPAASLATVAAIAVWIGQPSSDRTAGPASSSLESQANSALPPQGTVAQSETAPSAFAPAVPVTSPASSAPVTSDAPAAQARRAEPLRTTGALELRDLARAASADNTVPQGASRPAPSLADAASPAAPAPPAVSAATPTTAEARAEKATAAPAAEAPTPAPAVAQASEARSARGPSAPAGLKFVAVVAISPRLAWGITADSVLRTTDGETWTRVSAPPDAPFSAVAAVDAERATVTTVRGLRYDTSDGGASWRRVQ